MSCNLIYLFLLLAYHLANGQRIINNSTNAVAEPPVDSSSGGLNPKGSSFIPVIIIFSFLVFGYLFFFLHGCIHMMNDNDALSPRPHDSEGLKPAISDTFLVLNYSKVKEIQIGRGIRECVVCLTEFHDDDTLSLMPICEHMFHRDCINTWLVSHVTCPVCRLELATCNSINKEKDGSSSTTSITPQIDSNEVVINVN
ncbi:hypothetical protein ACFE04_009461 [Oxalis oulophora]